MTFRISFILFIFCFIASCSSTTRDYKGVYEVTTELQDLTVPPGLNKPEVSRDSTLPELQRSIKTYSGYEEKQGTQEKARYAQDYEGMRFVRQGSLFWLEFDAAGEEIWDDVRSFFVRLGFSMKKEQPKIGYMETDWQENKVGVPTNFFSQLLSALYSVDFLDKFRIRFEWDPKQKITRLFINHQGLKEVAEEEDDNISVVTTKWVSRPADPELEVEMLMRFMAFRGLDIKVAEQHIDAVKQTQLTNLVVDDNRIRLTINAPFSRAWRYVGIALDRLGFLVEDKNRTAGIYYIELPETFVIPKQGGFFGSLFTSSQEPSQLKYLIVLEEKDDATVVTIKANGKVPEDMVAVSNKMLQDIHSSIL